MEHIDGDQPKKRGGEKPQLPLSVRLMLPCAVCILEKGRYISAC